MIRGFQKTSTIVRYSFFHSKRFVNIRALRSISEEAVNVTYVSPSHVQCARHKINLHILTASSLGLYKHEVYMAQHNLSSYDHKELQYSLRADGFYTNMHNSTLFIDWNRNPNLTTILKYLPWILGSFIGSFIGEIMIWQYIF